MLETTFPFDLDRRLGRLRTFHYSNNSKRFELFSAFHLPANEHLVASTVADPLAMETSLGRVLGDRRVLYKYLNRNMLSVASTGQSSNGVPFVKIYVLDAVKGAVLASMVHENSAGPVQLVQAENWVVYAFYNTKERTQQIDVMEFYESSEPDMWKNG